MLSHQYEYHRKLKDQKTNKQEASTVIHRKIFPGYNFFASSILIRVAQCSMNLFLCTFRILFSFIVLFGRCCWSFCSSVFSSWSWYSAFLSVISLLLISSFAAAAWNLVVAEKDVYTNAIAFNLPLPEPLTNGKYQNTDHPSLAKVQHPASGNWQHFIISKGDTLSALFARAGLARDQIFWLLQSETMDHLKYIVAGRQLSLLSDDRGQLQRLHYEKNSLETVIIEREAGQKFIVAEDRKQIDTQLDYAEGVISSSLFEDGRKAGLSDKLIMNLAEVFIWDIDFAQDIRPGDRFSVLYQQQIVDGLPASSGQILAASFVIQGKKKTAVYYRNADGDASYFSADARNLRKRFVRMPLDFGRISSGFNPNRRHPVLNTIRAHKGTDYAAPRHTPIKATGSGKVIFSGWSKGYGRTVIIDHGNGYTTLYAHMQNIHAKKGQKVQQSTVIGTVGTSGLATGPHVHYEFRVNGQYKNPATVALPGALALSGKEKEAFHQYAQDLFRKQNLMQMAVAYSDH